MAWGFELRDRQIRSWRPYEDRAEALRGGLSTPGSAVPLRCMDGKGQRNGGSIDVWRSVAARTARRPRPGAGRSSTASSGTATSSPAGSAPTARRRCGRPAAPRRAGPRHRLRLRRHHPAARRAGRARGRGVGVDVAEPLHRDRPPRGRRGGSPTSASRRRRAGRRELGGRFDYAFSRMGIDVLRQPRRGAAQRPRGAGARRPALHGRLAAQARQRVGASRRGGRRATTSSTPRSPTSRPAARGRSRWPTPTRSATAARSPASRRSRCGAATCR